jgi:hypothetical protein
MARTKSPARSQKALNASARLELTRKRIGEEADPVGFLIRVAKGQRVKASPNDTGKYVRLVYPTMDQRMKANEILAAKVAPDLKAMDVTMDQSGNVIVKIMSQEGKVIDGKVVSPSQNSQGTQIREARFEELPALSSRRKAQSIDE